MMRKIALAAVSIIFAISCTAQEKSNTNSKEELDVKIKKTEEEWKKELTPEQYSVLREAGTERAGTGEYNMHKEDGHYHCAGCNTQLFVSSDKYDSGSGWPSFDDVANSDSVILRTDGKFGMQRTEVLCGTCGGHLGHVFNDGPTDTGLRYCINSAALEFEKEKDDKAAKK
jgi:peptide-methionine (R)-S-oxide reductase